MHFFSDTSDTLKDNQDWTNYENLLTVLDIKVHNFEPTGATIESESWIHHIMSNNQLQTETVPTIISDRYTIIAKFAVLVSKNQATESSPVSMKRNLKFIEKRRCSKFFLPTKSPT